MSPIVILAPFITLAAEFPETKIPFELFPTSISPSVTLTSLGLSTILANPKIPTLLFPNLILPVSCQIYAPYIP